jgi:hypothetical protein
VLIDIVVLECFKFLNKITYMFVSICMSKFVSLKVFI